MDGKSPGPKRILYVEDDPFLREDIPFMLESFMKKEGVRIHTAGNIHEFLEKIGIRINEAGDARKAVSELCRKLRSIDSITGTVQFLRENIKNKTMEVTHDPEHDFDFILMDNALSDCPPSKCEGPQLIKLFRALHDYLLEEKMELGVPHPPAVLYSNSELDHIFPQEEEKALERLKISGFIQKRENIRSLSEKIKEIHRVHYAKRLGV